MSFIKKSAPPPEVKEGEVLTAKVVNIEYPVKGQYGEQVRFILVLPNGYECNSWMKYYQEPSDKSSLGILSITFMNTIKGPVESVKDVLEGIKKLGNVYIKCRGSENTMRSCTLSSKLCPTNFHRHKRILIP